MINNDLLRRISTIFGFNDEKILSILELGQCLISSDQLTDFFKEKDDDAYQELADIQLASFLNGLIIEKRGKQDGPRPEAEKVINNNIVLRKLKIALNLKNEDVLEILAQAGLIISKHELSAFFRRPDHKHFRHCKDQVLRNFLQGMQMKFRPGSEDPE